MRVSETQCWRVVRHLEERLLESGEFCLARKQAMASNLEFEVYYCSVLFTLNCLSESANSCAAH